MYHVDLCDGNMKPSCIYLPGFLDHCMVGLVFSRLVAIDLSSAVSG